MDWIDTQDIILWGQRIDSKGDLPMLVARLIRATSPLDTSIVFPKGADTYSGGWDGIVEASKKTALVPEGISLWELSTDNKNRAKAERDYLKRVADPLGYDPKECTYVCVTANKWGQKNKWKKEKQKEGVWKDVLVYDAVDLGQWLTDAPATARWFAVVIRKPLPEGIQPTEDYWAEYSMGPKCTLVPKVITCNREIEVEQIKTFLAGSASFKAIQAPSKEEAIAFIIAAVMQHNLQDREKFFAKSLIIDTPGTFRSISNYRFPMVLITRFEDMQPIFLAASKGHHVLIPLGADDTFSSSEIINLPKVSVDLEDSLKGSGLSDEEARKYSVESGRNITILKRLLEFPSLKIKWATDEFAKSLVPALLLGRWDESYKGDKEVVAWLAGEDYQTYVDKISRWKNDPIPFIYQIGTCWRLTSPLDAWSALSSYIHLSELEKLKESLFKVLTEVKPSFDLEPDKRYMASFYGKVSPYSSWLREGISQSLILLGIYGSNLKIPFETTSQIWIDSIIKLLLNTEDENLWKSLNDVIPLLAEASPQSFMESVRLSIENDKKPILGMFTEDPSIVWPKAYHTGLLWALEELAWFEEYLPKATLLLGKLASFDPGGSITNRPINSLRSIFLPWLPQSLADLDKRKEALIILISENPSIAWSLLLMLLPEHHAVGHSTHKTRWRLFNENKFKQGVSYSELWQTYSFVIGQLIRLAGNEEDRLSKLVSSIELFPEADQQILLNHIESNGSSIHQKTYAIWHSFRKTLHWHRAYSDALTALPEEKLQVYQSLYDKLKPTDIIDQNIWLFNEYPEFADTNKDLHSDFDIQGSLIFERRKEALAKIYENYGISKIIELAEGVKEQFHFGQALAFIITSESETLEILNQEWLSRENPPFVLAGYISTSQAEYKFEWIKNYYHKLTSQAFPPLALANFLIFASVNRELLDFLTTVGSEIESLYWVKTRPHLYQLETSDKEYCIRKLIDVERFNAAVVELGHFVKDLPTDFILFVLESKRNQSTVDNTFLRSHEIENIFQEVYKRGNFDKSKLAKLEWFYLPYFGYSHSRTDNTLLLQEELSTNPDFFIEILKFLYKRKDEKKDLPLIEKKSDAEEEAHKMALANNAYTLLSAWEKIPGSNDKDEINAEVLNTWVIVARELATEASRLEVADVHIGKVFAKFSEKSELQWPPDEICQIIDTINSESMKSGFRTETFNKRGSSSRGPYEGGNRERKLSNYFIDLSKIIELKWPVTASILNDLAQGYLFDAKRIDEEAARDSLEY